MELIFNLLWLMLSSALVLWWIARRRRGNPDRYHDRFFHSNRMQIVALAMLIVILLPVVSLTDDLSTSTAPVETERFAQRIHLQDNPDSHLHALSVALVAVLAVEQATRLQTLAHLHPPAEARISTGSFVRVSGIRPPPSA